MLEAIRRYTGIDFEAHAGREVEVAREAGIRLKPGANAGQAILETFEQRVEEHLIQPVFITDHRSRCRPLPRGAG